MLLWNCRMASSWFVLSTSVLLTLATMQHAQAANIRREWKEVFGKEGYCHLQCIQEIFTESCEGMNCTIIYDGSREDAEKACKADCIQAVTSNKMRKCLKEGYPDNDVDWMMRLSFYHYPGKVYMFRYLFEFIRLGGCYGDKYKVEDVYGGSIVSLEFDEFLEFYDIEQYY